LSGRLLRPIPQTSDLHSKSERYLWRHYQPLENMMGKYLIAWVLGVPAVLLAGIYLLSHL
jgi:hypothetical protein